ncbi:MAG: methyltransferase family protein [Planctomycetota bacterium]|jgi:protein-S-isoprenylcysteine O-methyltransferase Ste14
MTIAAPSTPQTIFTWVNWERCVNFLLALYFLRFACMGAADLTEAFRLSTFLMLLKVSADTAFHLIRKPAEQISTSLYDWSIGIFGAFTNFLYEGTLGNDLWWATSLQLMGMSLQVAGMLSLNRSIGFVAANRGVRTSGMYRFVRHPLYFSYCVSFMGFLLNHFTAHNLIVYLTMVSMLFLRILAEERLLSRSPEYQAYQKQVRYRLIPGLV